MKKMKFNDLIYCLAFVIFNIFIFVSSSTLPIDLTSYRNYIYLVVFFLLFISNFEKKINFNFVFSFIFVFLSIVIIFINLKNVKLSFIIMVFFVFSSKGKNIFSILRIIIGLNILLLLVVFLLSKFSIINNNYYYASNGIIRQSLGMIHPNTFFNYYFMIVICYFYLSESNSKYKYVLVTILTLIIYFYTRSRTGIIIYFLYLILDFIICKRKIELKKIYSFTPILLLMLSILLVHLYRQKTSLGIQLDSIFSNRLMYASSFYDNYGIKLFGNNVVYKTIIDGVVKNKNNILDISYIYILIDNGIFFACIIILSTVKLLKKIIYFDLKKEFLIIIILLLYGLTERFIFDPVPNFTILLYSILFIKKRGDFLENRN